MRAVAALVAACAPALAQELSTRVYDVSALELAAHAGSPGVDLRRSLGAARPSASAELEEPPVDGPLLPLESSDALRWAVLLASLFDVRGSAPDAIELVTYEGGLLVVAGTPAGHDELAAVLADLADHVFRPVDLELVVLDPAELGPGTRSVLSAAEVDALLASATPLETARVRGRLDAPAQLGSTRLEAYVCDYDALGLKYAVVGEPHVALLREGTEVAVDARALGGGGLYVRAWGRRMAEQGERRALELPTFDGAAVALPRVASTVAAGSACIEDGGALVLAQEWSGGEAWVVRARRAEPVRANRALVPAARLLARPFVVRTAQVLGPWSTGDDSRWDPPSAPDVQSAFERASMAERIVEALSHGHVEGSAHPLGGQIYVGDDPEREAVVRAAVEAAEAPLRGTVAVEVRIGWTTRALAAALANDGADVAGLAHLFPRRLLATAAPSDTLLVTAGVESTYLADWVMSGREAVGASNPIFEDVFEGVALWMRPARAPHGRIAAAFALEVQHAEAELARQRVVGPRALANPGEWPPEETGPFLDVGVVELPSVRRVALAGTVALEPRTWTLLGSAEVAGAERALVALVRAEIVE